MDGETLRDALIALGVMAIIAMLLVVDLIGSVYEAGAL